ncbi:hypothetical protein ACFQ8C_14115 [Streptomyces sp. NPDC056503]|uniref:hypothetical protein n=1 Tax=Streptomyces sp. NPDC056503 TaxID=3345842 RepID=UPI0036933820
MTRESTPVCPTCAQEVPRGDGSLPGGVREGGAVRPAHREPEERCAAPAGGSAGDRAAAPGEPEHRRNFPLFG